MAYRPFIARDSMTSLLALLAVLGACTPESEPITPPDNASPGVTISEPLSGTSVAESTAVVLGGSATDPEDGALGGDALAWASSLDGPLGNGAAVTVPYLSPGTHQISLRASDSQGADGEASISLTVTALHPPPALRLETVVRRLSQPVFLTTAPGDVSRLFVVEKTGTIRIIRNGAAVGRPFLDLSDSISNGSEQGLLGMAFAPDYATSGRFYVSYTNPQGGSAGSSVVARYRVSATDPDSADPQSGQQILRLNDPYSNHNGGMVVFGPDGYLYFGMGDGGGGGDPLNSGQDRSDWFGSLLRLDVSGAAAGYAIPPTNPYAGSSTFRRELWNYGLRNPWRFSFDRQNGDLYIGDVGQNRLEEIDVQPAGVGGSNYGWSTMEGLSCYGASSCNQSGLTMPVLDYTHDSGNCSVTGGYVYRGSAIPSLQGHYLYADYCAGWVRSFRYQNGGAVDRQARPTLSPNGSITSFGEDGAGELYILTQDGDVFRIVAS